MLVNQAEDPDFASIKVGLREMLELYLVETSDPRSQGLSLLELYYRDKPVLPR